MSKEEGVKMVAYLCPICGARIKVSEKAVDVTCANKHRKAKMVSKPEGRTR